MAGQTILRAWSSPAVFSVTPVDHTWVTTFDNQAQNYADANAVAAAGENYWFCWGDYHAQGGTPINPTGQLDQRAGSLSLAACLVQPNADCNSVAAARGTIFSYGSDGVCHQLANQVLYATGSPGAPMTVSQARGYAASIFLYGTYGRQVAAWAAKIQGCSQQVLTAAADKVFDMATLPDEFERHARDILGDENPTLLKRLMALRSGALVSRAPTRDGFQASSARALNDQNQRMLDEAASLLGPEKFEQVFGFPANREINLIDPNMLVESRSKVAP